jgi:hypothetical protein
MKNKEDKYSEEFVRESEDVDEYPLPDFFEDEDNKEQIKGGKADNLTIQELANKHNVELSQIKKELKQGMEVEMEHTDDPKIALEIAMDHLSESPVYYEELAKMESKFKD